MQQELEEVIINKILQPSGSAELDSLTKTVVGWVASPQRSEVAEKMLSQSLREAWLEASGTVVTPLLVLPQTKEVLGKEITFPTLGLMWKMVGVGRDCTVRALLD